MKRKIYFFVSLCIILLFNDLPPRHQDTKKHEILVLQAAEHSDKINLCDLEPLWLFITICYEDTKTRRREFLSSI